MSKQIKANTADELFDKTLDELLRHKSNIEDTPYEIINANLVLLDPTRNTMCNSKRKMSMRYAIGELLWYISRKNTAKSIEVFSKFWKTIANKDGTVNSNYGWCIHDKYMFDQWENVKQILINDQNSRQAIIHIKEPSKVNKKVKDVNCTLTLQFLIRKGKLDLIVNMRSNDIWLGLPYDVFNFTCMQILMAMELDLKIGTYYHNAGSLHIYSKDMEKIK